ncbi:MAG TPA: hypothetical protein P5572_08515 [Phycisphaerae bacterium]|nr:hypothetical protein [Phycisphaerae bacterium]
MSGSSSRFARLKAAANTVGVLIIATGVVMVVLSFLPEYAARRVWLGTGGILAVLCGAAWIIAALLLIKIESNTSRYYNQQLDHYDLARQQCDALAKLVDVSMLSDAARSLANRDRECEALRTAIRADLRTERWDAALKLIDEMAIRFGYAEEAEGLRTEATEARAEALRQKLTQASAVVERHLAEHNWEKARKEIERLERALPEEPRIARLRQLYHERFNERKQELLKAWNNAVSRNDVDAAIATLQDLDSYLTRDEARSLEESARHVFKTKLLQLGMQFQFAITEKRWRDALEVGLQIMEEFPNARMSKEVGEAIDGLRARAGLHDVEVTTAADHTDPASA